MLQKERMLEKMYRVFNKKYKVLPKKEGWVKRIECCGKIKDC